MSNTAEEEKTEQNIRARFKTLPLKVTTAQIAWATFRTSQGVGNWINQIEDFPPVVGNQGRSNLRDRDAVEAWYFLQPFATGENRGRRGGRSAAPTRRGKDTDAEPAAAVSREQVIAAFAELPKYVTREQICTGTGRATVNNWVSHGAGFPEPVQNEETAALAREHFAERGIERRGDPEYRENAAVLAWYLAQPFASGVRRGPKDTTALALAAVPKATRLTVPELTSALGLAEKKTVYLWAEPDARPGDPFPPADSASMREWAAVRSWLLRKDDPLPEDAAELEAWLLRYVDQEGPGSYLTDEHGLTLGARDAVERARVARAAGRPVDASYLAELLGEDEDAIGALLAGDGAPPAPSHLFPTGLARELGLDQVKLKHFARYYQAGEDPFPPSVEGRGHEVAAVRSWLRRRGLLADAPEPAEG